MNSGLYSLMTRNCFASIYFISSRETTLL